MVNPYLNRDESIILTTHNVRFGSIVTELVLTSQRLLLFDSGHAQFRFQTIPLSTIETVIPGEDAQGNLIISLSIKPLMPDSAPQSKEFVFFPHPGGERTQERDMWIKQLKEQIAAVRREALSSIHITSQKTPDIIFKDGKTTGTSDVPADSEKAEVRPAFSIPVIAPAYKMVEMEQDVTRRMPENVISPVPEPESLSEPDYPPAYKTGEIEIGIPPAPEPEGAPEPDHATTDGTVKTEKGISGGVPEPEESPEKKNAHSPAETRPLSPAPPPPPVSRYKPMHLVIVAVTIIIIGIAMALSFVPLLQPNTPNSPETAVTTIIPTATILVTPTTVQQTPISQVTIEPTSLPTMSIPDIGVWVRVQYAGNFTGTVGTAGDIKQVNSSGDRVYQLSVIEGIVQATVQKQDGSGNTLTVEVYNNGMMIARNTKATPFGSVEMQVDLKKT